MSILLPGRQPPDTNEHPIYARSGWEIPQKYLLPDDRILIRTRELTRWCPKAIVRSVSPYPYNCVGMIFAARRAWIEIDHVYKILNEDGYRSIPFEAIIEGDIVLYEYNGSPAHVGVIMIIDRSFGPNIRVLSKWGKDAEFIHFIENVPEQLGKPTRYYTDRVPYEPS